MYLSTYLVGVDSRLSKHGRDDADVSWLSPCPNGLQSFSSLVIHLLSPSQLLRYNLLDRQSSQNLVKLGTNFCFNIVEIVRALGIEPKTIAL